MKQYCIIVQNYFEIDPRVRREAEALVSLGHAVDVIALRGEGRSSEPYVVDGVTVYTIDMPKKRGGKLRYMFEYLSFFVSACVLVTKLHRRRRYYAIEACTLPDFLIFATIFARLSGAKAVLDMHEIMPEFFMSKYGVGRGHWMIRALLFLERISLMYADTVITITDPVLELFESRGLKRGKGVVVMNSVDEGMFAAAEDAAEPSTLRFMYHGTLTRTYGLDIALQAYAQAVEALPGSEFWIVGDGPERTALESLVNETPLLRGRVRFFGRVDQREIPALIRQCTIGVLATRQDVFLDYSFSNKLPEYIFAGRAVISARLKTTVHYFTPDALAYFTPEDVADLTAQMIAVGEDPRRRAALVQNARAQYAAVNWTIMRERFRRAMDALRA